MPPELALQKKQELLRLKQCSVRALRGEARNLGVPEDVLTAAVEGDKPKEDLIRLVFKHTVWQTVTGPEPEPEPQPEPEPEPAPVEEAQTSAAPEPEDAPEDARKN
eukprot:COSAG03_NODE_1617_length_3766_cov_310.939187_5_plen_106_part_00